ncbi:hypothetical protein HFU84_01925 [Acidithiobacillus sp. CV18-2]|uniref:Tetratricopeptide repeat protein n=1 Tax=Igneacidithiobacillus copahuensis TaxID=2724909 RepID=A0AAE3CKT4_9PROT|nr:hypothetical protein [Igneacidithiobacillus copahuensis]MBU2753664.1 hypothetical protein [Acidithiobacillus sp. CV18-3]MBU2757309.1 hypothetical protein [Acidithiobacillus sp. BN09-2]MBU2776291.1 hypothetical protein [Acidithiobacillus sp. CV18-2]MBU2796252.1 hypothetical protein [Acidithiobacillus sp. VAN18-2]MBU2798462.1 hypothetical protein [Acidithiobacillus sp. VAN18-4]UTV82226.1 hypothetical protein MQE22_06315 [Acidithiobacillus sp. YTS05]
MRSFIARLIFLVILVVIVLFGIVAIQHPDTWQKDWLTVRAFFLRHWQDLQGQKQPRHSPPPKVEPARQHAPMSTTPPPVMPTQPAAPETVSPTPRRQAQLNERQLTLLMAARRAFWLGDYPVAIGDYRALINADPEQAALYGELGNVLWHAGQRNAAATAYAHAGRLLLIQGNYREAAALIPILMRLDPEAAANLQEELAR